MTQSLGEALPEAIAKVSELIGTMTAQANDLDDVSPGAGDGTRMMVKIITVKRDVALAAQQRGDVIAMMAAYQAIKPALDLAK